jgi:hypothetical protein
VPSNRFNAYTPADRDVKLQCAGRFRERRKSSSAAARSGPLFASQHFFS